MTSGKTLALIGMTAATALVIGCNSDTTPAPRDASSVSTGGGSSTDATSTGADGSKNARTATFFVSSDTSKTANLGGLSGADARCARLAAAASLPAHTWRAYLSVEHGDAGPVDARDRIGAGPWYNVNGVELAADLASLHARTGDADVFLSELGGKIPGQWPGSPTVEHDVLTGSTTEGRLLAGETCSDWTSESSTETAQVGHSDGLGPNQNPNPPYSSWNSAHANGGCNDTAPLGGAGRIYCFAFAIAVAAD